MNTKVSALILTYNQEHLVEKAIHSVVSQTLQPNEIVISDDGSSDDSWAVIQSTIEKIQEQQTYVGKFILNRNEKNIGFIRNFNLGAALCNSELIMYNAGDDTSMKNRCEIFVKEYESLNSPKYFLGHSSVLIDDEIIRKPPIASGEFSFERLSISCALHIGASQFFSKSLLDDFGEIRFEQTYEDLILGYRALLTDAYCYVDQPLLKYDMSGLSGWKKNGYWKKRLRFKETLEQRIVDSVRQGRHDAVSYISDCYQQYGFSQQPHPFVIEITWLDFAISNRPLSPYQSDNFEIVSPFISTQRLTSQYEMLKSDSKNYYVTYPVFIEWGETIATLTSSCATVIVDLGYGEIELEAIEKIYELNSTAQYYFLAPNENFKEDLVKYGRFASGIYFHSVEGDTLTPDYNRTLVVFDSKKSELEIRQLVEKNFDFKGISYTSINDLKENINGKFSNYGIVMFLTSKSLSKEQSSYLNELSAINGFNYCCLAIDELILMIKNGDSIKFENEKKYMIRDHFMSINSFLIENNNALKEVLYFNNSIQKCIVQYVNLFEILLKGKYNYEKLFPL